MAAGGEQGDYPSYAALTAAAGVHGHDIGSVFAVI